MRKRQIILIAMLIGLLAAGTIYVTQPASAQSSSPTPRPTRTATPTKTPTPTPLGGIDTQTKAKIINDLNQGLSKADSSFARESYESAVTAYTAVLTSVRQYKVNDAFLNDKDKPQMLGFEFRALSGLGRTAFGKAVKPGHPNDLGERSFTDLNKSDADFTEMEDWFTQALEVAAQLPPKLRGLGWVYFNWGRSYTIRGETLMGVRNSPNYFKVLRTDAYRTYIYKAYQAFVKAADAFGQTGELYNQSAAYWHLGVSAWELEGLPQGDVAPLEWYKIVEKAHDDGQKGGFGYGWDHPCQSRLEFTQRLINGSIQDASVDINAELASMAKDAPSCANLRLWRGTANAMLSWRTEDKALAQNAIGDLRPAISEITGERNWVGGLIYSNYVTYTAYSTHYLGRSLSLMGTQPDLALYYLQQADAAFSRTNPPPNLAPPLGIEWDNTEAQYQNIRLIGDNLTFLGRPREAIDQYKRVEQIKDYEKNPIYADVQLGLSNAYIALGRYDEAVDPLNKRKAFYEQEIKNEQAKGTPDQALIKRDQGKLIDVQIKLSTPLAILGRTEEALTGLQSAVDQATALNDQQLLVDTILKVGDIYLQLDSEDNAIASYTKAAELADKPKLPLEQGQALLGLGQLQVKRGLVKDAQSNLQKANQAAASARDYTTQVRAFKALGDLALVGDKPNAATAQSSYAQALQIAQFTAKDPRLSIQVLSAQADLANQKDPNAAAVLYYRALVLAQNINDREDVATLYAHIGQINVAAGQTPVALQSYANAITVIEATQRGFQSESLTSQFAAKYAWVYADYLKQLISQKLYNQAFDVAERARARAFLDQLAIGPVDLRKGASADLLQQDNALRENIDAVRGLLIQAQSANPPDKERITRLKQQLDQSQRDYAALFTRMQATDPQLTTLTTVDVAPLSKIQAGLDADATLLSYYTTDAGTYAFIVTKSDFQVVQLDAKRQDLADAIAKFRSDEKQAAGLDGLAKDLIMPLLDKVTTKRLIIVPHNVLNYLPFAALPLDSSTLLGDKFAISYLPSANTLLHLPEKPKESGDLLALGNPIAEGFKPLPFAEQEVKTVSQIVKGTTLTESDAKEAVIWNQGTNAGILYLAAHGTFNPINPLFSALHLTPGDGQSGSLESYKIYQLDLTKKTDLVVLSACETAVGKLSAGDEFSGLNRAFLYAGAPNVLASLWSVDDKATGMLMESFFAARAKGATNAEALQTAQAAVRNYKDTDGKTPYSSPYFWAAFILTGRG